MGVVSLSEEDIEEYYVGMYLDTFNAAVGSFEDRFTFDPVVLALEKYLATEDPSTCLEDIAEVQEHVGNVSTDELMSDMTQFRRFEKQNNQDVATDAASIGTKLSVNQTLKQVLPGLVKTVKLVLLIPATSCSAERSFTSLRRLRTYLSSTMTQKRLNHLAILHNHTSRVDYLDLDEIIDLWREVSQTRQNAVASKIEAEEWREE